MRCYFTFIVAKKWRQKWRIYCKQWNSFLVPSKWIFFVVYIFFNCYIFGKAYFVIFLKRILFFFFKFHFLFYITYLTHVAEHCKSAIITETKKRTYSKNNRKYLLNCVTTFKRRSHKCSEHSCAYSFTC